MGPAGSAGRRGTAWRRCGSPSRTGRRRRPTRPSRSTRSGAAPPRSHSGHRPRRRPPSADPPAYWRSVTLGGPPSLVSVGTPLHAATAPLTRKQQWREWSGFFASSAYADAPDIEYNAIREAAALIDVSPLYKYVVGGPDARRLVDRVITRDASKLTAGRVFYTPWCDEHVRGIDDGTVHGLDDGTFRWTAADPQLRWLRMNSAGLDVAIEDVTDSVAAVALQGPQSRAVLETATGASFDDLRYFARRASTVK